MSPIQGVDDPTMVDFPVQYWEGEARIINASHDIWAKIEALIKARVDAALTQALETANSLTNVACTMGTPGVPLVANATTPWAHVVVPFPALIARIEYFYAPMGSAGIDVRIQRPGQTVEQATTFYPYDVPTFDPAYVERVMPSSGWQDYCEPGTVLLFYVTSVSGVELVTANVILRTIG